VEGRESEFMTTTPNAAIAASTAEIGPATNRTALHWQAAAEKIDRPGSREMRLPPAAGPANEKIRP
jgi:hypothetical protein